MCNLLQVTKFVCVWCSFSCLKRKKIQKNSKKQRLFKTQAKKNILTSPPIHPSIILYLGFSIKKTKKNSVEKIKKNSLACRDFSSPFGVHFKEKENQFRWVILKHQNEFGDSRNKRAIDMKKCVASPFRVFMSRDRCVGWLWVFLFYFVLKIV